MKNTTRKKQQKLVLCKRCDCAMVDGRGREICPTCYAQLNCFYKPSGKLLSPEAMDIKEIIYGKSQGDVFE